MPQVGTGTVPVSAAATAVLEEVRVGLPSLPVLELELSGIRCTSFSTCENQSGGIGLALSVAGRPVRTEGAVNLIRS